MILDTSHDGSRERCRGCRGSKPPPGRPQHHMRGQCSNSRGQNDHRTETAETTASGSDYFDGASFRRIRGWLLDQ